MTVIRWRKSTVLLSFVSIVGLLLLIRSTTTHSRMAMRQLEKATEIEADLKMAALVKKLDKEFLLKTRELNLLAAKMSQRLEPST